MIGAGDCPHCGGDVVYDIHGQSGSDGAYEEAGEPGEDPPGGSHFCGGSSAGDIATPVWGIQLGLRNADHAWECEIACPTSAC